MTRTKETYTKEIQAYTVRSNGKQRPIFKRFIPYMFISGYRISFHLVMTRAKKQTIIKFYIYFCNYHFNMK